jgi:hypothetical protein
MLLSRVGDAEIDELEDNGFEDVLRGVLEAFSTIRMAILGLCGPRTTGRPPRGSRTLVVGIARFPERAAPRNATCEPKFTISILISRSPPTLSAFSGLT